MVFPCSTSFSYSDSPVAGRHSPLSPTGIFPNPFVCGKVPVWEKGECQCEACPKLQTKKRTAKGQDSWLKGNLIFGQIISFSQLSLRLFSSSFVGLASRYENRNRNPMMCWPKKFLIKSPAHWIFISFSYGWPKVPNKYTSQEIERLCQREFPVTICL